MTAVRHLEPEPRRPGAPWLLPAATLLCAAGYALVFLVALHTPRGLHVDAVAYERLSGSAGAVVQPAGRQALRTIDAGTLALGIVVLAFLALVRGRLERAAAAAAVVVCSVGSSASRPRIVAGPSSTARAQAKLTSRNQLRSSSSG